MCAAMAFFVANDTLLKLASADLPVHQLLFLRGSMATVLVMTAVLIRGEHKAWRSLRHPLVALRGLMECFVAFTFIGALSLLNIADLTAISLLAPLLITAFGAIFLKEDVRWRRWAAVGVGCLGMLLVVRPGGGVFGPAALLALVSTVAVAARDLMTRRLPVEAPTLLVTASTIVLLTALSGLVSLALPSAPVRAEVVALLAGSAVLVIAGNFAIVAAFRGVEVSAVSPFRYSAIVWAVVASWLVFGEFPSSIGWLGIALIVGGGLYAMHRETVAARRPQG